MAHRIEVLPTNGVVQAVTPAKANVAMKTDTSTWAAGWWKCISMFNNDEVIFSACHENATDETKNKYIAYLTSKGFHEAVFQLETAWSQTGPASNTAENDDKTISSTVLASPTDKLGSPRQLIILIMRIKKGFDPLATLLQMGFFGGVAGAVFLAGGAPIACAGIGIGFVGKLAVDYAVSKKETTTHFATKELLKKTEVARIGFNTIVAEGVVGADGQPVKQIQN